MTYDNIQKSHKKTELNLLCEKCIFGKTTGGGQIDPPAFLRLTSGLLQYTLHVLDFLWFDIFDVKSIQNVTTFLRIFYVRYHFNALRFGTQLCFHLLFEYSHVFKNEKITV